MPYNQLIAVWRGNTFCMISSLWNLLKLPLHNNTWLVLQINHSKCMCLLQLQCVVLHMYQLGQVYCSCSVLKSCSTLVTPWTAAHQDSLSFTTSWSLLKFMSIDSVMLSNHFILHHPLLLLPWIFPSIRVFFSNVSALCFRWPKYWSFHISWEFDIETMLWYAKWVLLGLIIKMSKDRRLEGKEVF